MSMSWGETYSFLFLWQRNCSSVRPTWRAFPQFDMISMVTYNAGVTSAEERRLCNISGEGGGGDKQPSYWAALWTKTQCCRLTCCFPPSALKLVVLACLSPASIFSKAFSSFCCCLNRRVKNFHLELHIWTERFRLCRLDMTVVWALSG